MELYRGVGAFDVTGESSGEEGLGEECSVGELTVVTLVCPGPSFL